jgi:hypothetical protein
MDFSGQMTWGSQNLRVFHAGAGAPLTTPTADGLPMWDFTTLPQYLEDGDIRFVPV